MVGRQLLEVQPHCLVSTNPLNMYSKHRFLSPCLSGLMIQLSVASLSSVSPPGHLSSASALVVPFPLIKPTSVHSSISLEQQELGKGLSKLRQNQECE